VSRVNPTIGWGVSTWRYLSEVSTIPRLIYIAWLMLSPVSKIVYWLGFGLCFFVFLMLRWVLVEIFGAPSSKPTNRRRAHAIFMHQHFGLHCTFALAWSADRWGALSMMFVGVATDLWREYRLRHPRGGNEPSHIELFPFGSVRSRVVQASVLLGGALLVGLWVTEPTDSSIPIGLDHAVSAAGHLQFAIGRFSGVLESRGLADAALRFRIVMSLCVIMILYYLLFYTIPLYEHNIGLQRRKIFRPLRLPVVNFLLLLFGYMFFYTIFISTYGMPSERGFWSGLKLTGNFAIQDAAVLILISYFLSSVSVSFYLTVAGLRSESTDSLSPRQAENSGNDNE